MSLVAAVSLEPEDPDALKGEEIAELYEKGRPQFYASKV